MRVTFWGTRGSIPSPANGAAQRTRLAAVLAAATAADIADAEAIERFISSGCNGALPTIYGGNTSCVEVTGGGKRLILDMGSGARELAGSILRQNGPVTPGGTHVLMSHLHWDHMMGFPFFAPAYIPGNVIHIYACHDRVEEAFRRQHGAPSFPIPFDGLAAKIEFHVIEPDVPQIIEGFRVTPHLLHHTGGAYAYRIEREGRTVVYATDGEHKPEQVGPDYPYVGFVRDADVLIFDAQYSLADATTMKEDWGHSSNTVGVELAQLGGVKHLVFFHHDPLNNDVKLDEIVTDSRNYSRLLREGGPELRISAAFDGMDLTL